jgi:hypothetical protein
MATIEQAYVPSMSEAAVKAKSGKDWGSWFRLLDEAGAANLDHRAIAKLLSEEHGVPGWWSQMVTVEYERARGRRVRYQVSDGFSVSVSKTIATPLSKLYGATASAAKRKAWFPKGAFKLSSQTKDKYFRGAWNESARLEIGFYAKGAGKSQIALAVSKLAKKADLERERKAWKAALVRLQEMLV